MDSSMQNMLSGILSNPESMKQILQLASSLGLINSAQAQPQPTLQPQLPPQQYVPQMQQQASQISLPPPVVPQSIYPQQASAPQQEQYMSGQPYAQPVYATADTQTRAPTPFDPIRPTAATPVSVPQNDTLGANAVPVAANPLGITPEKAMELLQSLQASTKPLVEDNHMALISALKPFMRPSRQTSLEGATKLLGAYRAFKGMGLKLF